VEPIRFGIVGCGLMGRELASAAARWCHLPAMKVRPELVAICDANPAVFPWYRDNFPSIRLAATDHRELLAERAVEAVYVAVPHHLHQQVYCDVISSGRALMGEKPFGIDQAANAAILECIRRTPKAFVRCSGQFPFFPAVQRICQMIEAQAFGQVIEVNAGFLHSSDLDPSKPINWKRMSQFNGLYGCMGDLGMHVCHIPFRAGWVPRNVRAVLSKIVPQRPDASGRLVPCDTWDNATLLCETRDPAGGGTFPMTMKMQRIAPGEKNTWYLQVSGTKACAKFSTKNPKRLEVLEYSAGRQDWRQIDTGQETAFASITGGIFEFGFSDAILQMWAAFVYELSTGKPIGRFASCATPEETALSHDLFTAALESQEKGTTVRLG
jgi:predicted dehydrogenase